MVGMIEVGHQLVWMGWCSAGLLISWIVGASDFVIFLLHHKTQKMEYKNTIV